MRYRIVIAAALVLTLACGAGAWAALGPGAGAFVLADAADLRVEQVGPNTWRVRYETAETGWQSAIALRLRHSGWRLEGDRYAWGDTEDYRPAYTRTLQYWLVQIDERAELHGSRSTAEIVVERRITLRR